MGGNRDLIRKDWLKSFAAPLLPTASCVSIRRKARNMKVRLLLSIIAISLFSCSDSTGILNQPPVRPDVGSYYVIHSYDFDSSGAKIRDPSGTIR